ncbi:hypothetical protein ColLi_06315 [Colletotrichum liriopes]|uniref:Uncharacterized protein n=1 Tax=Colletotrichum liriopes TaxID=708192 RepID=A0AA37GN55_9PEZI|nr:hypothetical protein ColLi_06315 [Colletotrichum liriopes]
MKFLLSVIIGAGTVFAGVISRAENSEAANIPVFSVDNNADGSLQAITHLYICSDANFSGRCQNLESNTGQCYTLGNGFNDVVSSLGPDQGTSCTIWENNGCSGTSISNIVSPGIFNLADSNWNFNDRSTYIRYINPHKP